MSYTIISVSPSRLSACIPITQNTLFLDACHLFNSTTHLFSIILRNTNYIIKRFQPFRVIVLSGNFQVDKCRPHRTQRVSSVHFTNSAPGPWRCIYKQKNTNEVRYAYSNHHKLCKVFEIWFLRRWFLDLTLSERLKNPTDTPLFPIYSGSSSPRDLICNHELCFGPSPNSSSIAYFSLWDFLYPGRTMYIGVSTPKAYSTINYQSPDCRILGRERAEISAHAHYVKVVRR